MAMVYTTHKKSNLPDHGAVCVVDTEGNEYHRVNHWWTEQSEAAADDMCIRWIENSEHTWNDEASILAWLHE